MEAEPEEDEKVCRYCFDGDEDNGPLISPCNCSGGQKWVHLKCLRRWQRMLLVSQPTHPDFYDHDPRHHICNVCKAEFTCPPPTRHELMASLTGPEIAALIDVRCIIASTPAFSTELETQLMLRGNPLFEQRSGYRHWIHGCFLITSVKPDEGQQLVPVTNPMELQQLRLVLGPELQITRQERTYRLAASHALEGIPQERLGAALSNLQAPCTICLVTDEAQSCGNDHVSAVNLSRKVDGPVDPRVVQDTVLRVCAKPGYAGARHVQLEHFRGGPCDEDDIACCIVLGGNGAGWTVVPELERAVELAHSRAVKRCDEQGEIHGGQIVRVAGLRAAPELNGEFGIALRFEAANGRWLVRLRSGEGKQLKPINLEGLAGASGRVLCFWGDAQWSRTQLLGEIAKRDWGLCRANVGDLVTKHDERWGGVQSRLAIAPEGEMTESYARDMEAARQQVLMHGPEQREEEDDAAQPPPGALGA